jgi:hypothetical protein
VECSSKACGLLGVSKCTAHCKACRPVCCCTHQVGITTAHWIVIDWMACDTVAEPSDDAPLRLPARREDKAKLRLAGVSRSPSCAAGPEPAAGVQLMLWQASR